MRTRRVQLRDIRCALIAAQTCEASGAAWKVTGPGLDGDDLTCVVAIEDGIVVVTVF